MRTIFVVIYFIFVMIVSLPLYLFVYLIGKKDPMKMHKVSQSIVSHFLKIILFLAGAKVTVKGLENVPTHEAVLYVGNHRGYFDILLGYTTVPTPTSFVSKKEMLHFPCVNRWMKFLSCLFLDRDNVREGLKTILQGIEQIKAGYSVFIMPEGTRSQGANLLPFHEGSFKLAQKSGCAIIPVAMTHTDDLWENQFPWMRSAKVSITYGKPIYMKDLEKEEQKFIGAYVQKIVEKMLEEENSGLSQEYVCKKM
ncbi:lysophospholipid acyltransferase family protein [Acetivibrio ethanolgignens]